MLQEIIRNESGWVAQEVKEGVPRYDLYRWGSFVATFYTRTGAQLFVSYHGAEDGIRWVDAAPATPESVMSEQAVHYAPDA